MVKVQTRLTERELLELLKVIEGKIGRAELPVTWGPRAIDLDILFYGDSVLEEPDLIIPHPFVHQRKFMLKLMCEISPDFEHPKLKKNMKKLLEEIG